MRGLNDAKAVEKFIAAESDRGNFEPLRAAQNSPFPLVAPETLEKWLKNATENALPWLVERRERQTKVYQMANFLIKGVKTKFVENYRGKLDLSGHLPRY